ncbi:MAG: hypothetical protein Q9214_007797 [Letrouitia sp. 1 TL-2023]
MWHYFPFFFFSTGCMRGVLELTEISKEFLEMLQPYLPRLPQRGIIHSFTGTLDEARSLMSHGFSIGVNGCSLKTAENLAVVGAIPLEKMMLETDGPWCEIRASHAGFGFLKGGSEEKWASVKKERWEKGKMVKGRNEPCMIERVARVVSGVKGMRVEDVADHAWRNSVAMFGFEDPVPKISPPPPAASSSAQEEKSEADAK